MNTTSAAHTPGPWKVRKLTYHFAIDAAHDVRIADVRFIGRPDGTTSEVEATLIAAAPDLLAALLEIVAMTNEDAGAFRRRGGTYRGLVSLAAEAAIARATGAA